MENNRTDRQPRTVDFSLFDQIEKAVPAYDLDKAIQKRDYRIDLTQHYADAEYLLTVDGIGMLAKGDIQAVKGKAKQGKTFFITALVAAVLNGKFGALKASGEDYRVLIVDTEQNMKNVARNARKIHRLCGWPENENHPRFSAVALRGYNTDERREILEGEIALLKPDLVILDGIKDLCRNIMDNPESTDVLDLLSRLSQDNNTAICCILHENKSSTDSNMRGHLGTELINKCTEEYQVTKKDNVITIEQTVSRDAPLYDKLEFTIEEDGMPSEIAIAIKTHKNSIRKTIAKTDYWRQFFINQSSYTRKELHRIIMESGEKNRTNAYAKIRAGLNEGKLTIDEKTKSSRSHKKRIRFDCALCCVCAYIALIHIPQFYAGETAPCGCPPNHKNSRQL